MLTRHRRIRRHRPQRRTQLAPAVPVGHVAAPALTSALALPSLAGIPGAFVSRSAAGNGQLKVCATALADAGILRPEHMSRLRSHGQHKPKQTLAAVFKAESEPVAKQLVEIALADLTRQHRPNPRVKLSVMVASDCSLFNQEDYDSPKSDFTAGGLLVSCNCQNPVHLEIGPSIKRIEQSHPGLGQTVLYWMSRGFDTTVRACDPRTAVHWASNNYWQGESDESGWLEEQMEDAKHYHKERMSKLPEAERTPFNPAEVAKELGTITRAEVEKELPQDICDGEPKLSRAALLRLRRDTCQPFTHIINATLAVMDAQPDGKAAPKNDLGHLEFCSWFVCPYLLRWHRPAKGDEDRQDSLGMFWDDYLNNEFQAGETNLTANSAFLWNQDEPAGIVNAFQRFTDWCRTLQAAENLLTAMHPREI